MWFPWQQEKVYLSSFAVKTLPIYFLGQVKRFQEKAFVVSELCSKNLKGGPRPSPNRVKLAHW